MILIGQVANIVSIILYGLLAIVGVAFIILIYFALHKLMMWGLYSTGLEKREKKNQKGKQEKL